MITFSTNKSDLDLALVTTELQASYWAASRSRETIERSIENSLCFGAYLDGVQIGFARVVTDKSIFAFLLDVFIVKDKQGKGYGKQLMQHILSDTELQAVEQWMLRTWDAHSFYEDLGFELSQRPDRIMEWIRVAQG